MQKAKPFLALLLCLGLAACLRQTPSFPVSEQEQTQDDQTLKIMYETRAADINGLQADTVDYNRTHGRTETKDYLKNKEFRLNMVGYRILIAAYPMCPSPRKSRSMMVGIYSYIQLGVAPKIFWAGPNAVIGGLLFGFGIVMAGGCETGWMYRAMEGQVHYWLVGLGNIIGATALAFWWDDLAPVVATNFDKVNLLQVFGPQGGLIVTYLLLGLSLAAVLWWEKRFFSTRSTTATLSGKRA